MDDKTRFVNALLAGLEVELEYWEAEQEIADEYIWKDRASYTEGAIKAIKNAIYYIKNHKEE